MKPAHLESLRSLRQSLESIPPEPWEGVAAWAARALPLIRTICPEHLEDFQGLTQTPQWTFLPIFGGGGNGPFDDAPWDNTAEVRAAETQANAGIARRAKQKIEAWLDGVLEAAATTSESVDSKLSPTLGTDTPSAVPEKPRIRADIQTSPAVPQSWRDQRHIDFSEFPEVSTKKAFDADLPIAIAGASAGEPLSMIFVDVDDLKAMNTSFTNPRVNKALAALAGLLARVSRGKGKAYRYGGDEFAVLLPNTGLDEAVSTAERICHSVRTLSIPAEPEMTLTVSCGVASLADVSPKTSEALETAAATAGRSAKEKGKDRVERFRPEAEADES